MTLIDPNTLRWEDFEALVRAAPQFDSVVRLIGRESIRSRFDPEEIADLVFCAEKANERHRRRLRRMFEQYHGMTVAEIIAAFKAQGPPPDRDDEDDRPQLFLFTPLDS